MKINQFIHQKRKELSMTQEQVAAYLGVSAPAVHKWEKGVTYPDITLLPPLARLLKTDLNTLLSFHDDLTDIEIENFVCKLEKTVTKEGFDTAFHMAVDKIHEYPTCEKLLHTVSLYLEGALFLYSVPDPKPYKDVLESFYIRMSQSETGEIRDTAILMLLSYCRNRGDFAKAEELIKDLPSSPIDRQEQLAILYTQQGKNEDAKKMWESILLRKTAEILATLMSLAEIAVKEHRDDDATFFADQYESFSRQFHLAKWLPYAAHLPMAVERQDKDACLSILGKMLPAMNEEWEPQKSPLYRNLGQNASSFSHKLLNTIQNNLRYGEEFAFLRGNAAFDKLIAEFGHRN